MAVYKTYDTVGIREDLADIIYSISVQLKHLLCLELLKQKQQIHTHQWQTDALADVAANAAVEGDDISYGNSICNN